MVPATVSRQLLVSLAAARLTASLPAPFHRAAPAILTLDWRTSLPPPRPSLEAASASVRASDCDVAAVGSAPGAGPDSRQLALDERDQSNALALLTLLQLRGGDLDVDAAGRALADCRGASLLGRVAARQIPRGGEADLVTGQVGMTRDGASSVWRSTPTACTARRGRRSTMSIGLHRALGRWQRGGGATAPPWHLPSFELPQEREELDVQGEGGGGGGRGGACGSKRALAATAVAACAASCREARDLPGPQ